MGIDDSLKQQDRNVDQTILAILANNNQLYCHLHSKEIHTTNQCEVVKLVELKGWVRKKRI